VGVEVVNRRKEDGKYVYQVKDATGKLYGNGVWVAQEKLRAR
jgi:hypothetical protein